MRMLQIDPLPGYEPEVGRWLWALEEVRRRTLRLVEGLDQRTLDWEGPDGRENAIGSLLYHISHRDGVAIPGYSAAGSSGFCENRLPGSRRG